MTRQHLGICILAFATLLLELGLIRAFDVILDPSVGYMVLTTAMFALGLGGIYVYIFKVERFRATTALPVLTVLFACATLLVLFILNRLPFNLNFSGNFWVQLASWAGMYLTIFTPFFLSGIILSIIFSVESAKINSLYFADLAGAGLACLLLMLLIPVFGPGGMLFLLAGLLCIAAFCFSNLSRKALYGVVPVVLLLMAYPFMHGQYIEFADHANKRKSATMKQEGLREYVEWDPVSKMEVYAYDAQTKLFLLDGGQVTSWMYAFDGDYERERRKLSDSSQKYYFGLRSLVHYLKRDAQAETLIVGAAAGEESRLALIFGAREVDCIDMVGAMVRAVKGHYAPFSGNLFNHPQVRYQIGEARAFLRATNKKFDVIQMYSNSSSASIARGNGALQSEYLQTVEAYEEYFSHLKPDGILAINRHFYPPMLTTAARAWHLRGGHEFYRHVLVFERYTPDNLPTVLIKMTPWTAEEVEDARSYLARENVGREVSYPLAGPSQPILKNAPYEGRLLCGQDSISGFSLMFGTYGQDSLPYPVKVRIAVDGAGQVADFVLDGGRIQDNVPVELPLEAPWHNLRDREIVVRVSSENESPERAVSLWLDKAVRPYVPGFKSGNEMVYKIAFNPLNLGGNLIPVDFLKQPFPKNLAAQADYRLNPLSDNRPFFNMVRKTTRRLDTRYSKFLDINTAYVLNSQLLPVLSKDVLGVFVVGGMSLIFAAVFVFVPLRWTSKGGGRWPAMPWFLLYFSCLGAGFIIIELTLIQLCIRVIGHPTYTYAAVLFALLFSAALGSLFSQKLPGGIRPLVFVALVLYGLFFLARHQAMFTWLLQFGLPLRWLAVTMLIFPLGFLLGMPFPLGIGILGMVWPAGIAWAWGMNGFFTVVGGFLSMVCAFFLGFRATLLIALGIYVLALLAFTVISRTCGQRLATPV